MTTYKNFKTQVANIKTEYDLQDAHIVICQAYSSYKLTSAQFDDLCKDMRAKRLEKKIGWGASI